MSLNLLRHINGNSRGGLSRLISSYEGRREPRICWYPSAGSDFRALMYLHPSYAIIHPAAAPEPPPPEIFLFTDYYPWVYSTFLDTDIIYRDHRTCVRVESIERLPDIGTALDPGIVDFPDGSSATNKVLFMNIRINSTILGEILYPVLYVFAENEWFCARKMLAQNAICSHVIHIRYGGGCGGGGKASGVWMLNVLERLGCEVLVTDNRYYLQEGDTAAIELYPGLDGNAPEFHAIRTVPSLRWSCHGDVTWNRVH